jgi:LysR family transcriptional regulator, regulator for bpeEF and oprC
MPYQSERSLAELAAFVAVVESNGFSAAARASGARKATLSLRVSDLETRLETIIEKRGIAIMASAG